MSYVIKAVLGKSQHPEYGRMTLPFPIPNNQYDQTIGMLQTFDLGYSVNRDCIVHEIDSHYRVLGVLKDTLVNADELDYLAKRLDSFCAGEDAQFQAMAEKLKLTDIKDLINLTFCCQQATVITDFSKLEQAGREHFLNLHDGCADTEELANLDGEETAYLLIDGGEGVVTPYGVVYDNGMKLEQHYNGHQFPPYLYDSPLMTLEVTPKKGLREKQNPEYLYLPASEHQIERTLLRVGITALCDAQVRLDCTALPEKTAEALDLEHLSSDDLPAFNRMCQAIQPLRDAGIKKLNAVVLMTGASETESICRLAKNLDQFDFIPGIQTPEEYGRHMIQQSGHFAYDKDLEDFYDYHGYGQRRILEEGGQFNECGYVVYQGAAPLEELLHDDPEGPCQQGLQMGGSSC